MDRGAAATRDDSELSPELEELLALTAHELHEPLRKISAFSELLRQHAGPVLDEESRDYLARMERSAERMRTTLARVIAFARAARGLPFVVIDLGEVVAGAVEKSREALTACGATVTLEPLPAIDGDPFQMQQLVEQLLDNAIKFRDAERPLAVRIHAEPPRGDDLLVVKIDDNGQGFDDAYAERIFKPFERLHGRGQFPGSGMGLPICRKIAERHGGRLEAHGVPGKGAVLTLILPASKGKSRPSPAPHVP